MVFEFATFGSLGQCIGGYIRGIGGLLLLFAVCQCTSDIVRV